MRYQKNCMGFTLIETIMYIGLLAILMTGVVVATYQIIQSSTATSGRSQVQEEGGFVLRKIDWAQSGMSSFTLPSVSAISISKYDGTTVDIKLSGDKIVMQENGGTFLPLTTDTVRIISFVVANISAIGSGPQGVSARLILTDATTPNQFTFTTTRYIRK